MYTVIFNYLNSTHNVSLFTTSVILTKLFSRKKNQLVKFKFSEFFEMLG